jgi:hypothetical protein
VPVIEPALTEHQLVVLRQRVSAVWETLWHPPPADCATEERHTYLTEAERRKVIERLDKIERLGSNSRRVKFGSKRLNLWTFRLFQQH